MKPSSVNLLEDITGIPAVKQIPIKLQYERFIACQNRTIEALKKEVDRLWHYILFNQKIDNIRQNRIQHTSETEASGYQGELNKNGEIMELPIKENSKIQTIKSVLIEVMRLVEAQKPTSIIENLKQLKIKAEKQSQPIFIEKIKQINVPYYIEVPSTFTLQEDQRNSTKTIKKDCRSYFNERQVCEEMKKMRSANSHNRKYVENQKWIKQSQQRKYRQKGMI